MVASTSRNGDIDIILHTLRLRLSLRFENGNVHALNQTALLEKRRLRDMEVLVANQTSSADLARRGDQLLGEGARSEAIAHYQAALALDTTRSDTWYNLAWAYRANRQFDDALNAYGEALNYGTSRPEAVRLNRAVILADHLYQPHAAEEELNAALAVSPTFVPALLNLGTLHEDFGRADAAREAYRRVIIHEPGNGRARARLAMIDLAEGHVGNALDELAIGLPLANAAADRAELLYATATALDADRRFDAAFETLAAANSLAQTSARNRYDPEAQERLIDRLIATFQRPISGPALETNEVLQPIFVVGMFRSGSTLVEQLLARHSAIIEGGELEIIPALAHSALVPYPEAVAQFDASAIKANRSAYLTEMARVASSGRVTDKRCDNILHIGLIKTLFPNAPIVHTARHPLDTLISTLFVHFGEGVTYGYDQRDVAHYYIQYRRLLNHWRTLYGDAICDVDYDQLVIDPRAQIEPVLSSLGVTWNETARHASGTHSVRTASSWQVRKALHRQSSGRWQNYAKHLEPAQQMLSEAGLLQ